MYFSHTTWSAQSPLFVCRTRARLLASMAHVSLSFALHEPHHFRLLFTSQSAPQLARAHRSARARAQLPARVPCSARAQFAHECIARHERERRAQNDCSAWRAREHAHLFCVYVQYVHLTLFAHCYFAFEQGFNSAENRPRSTHPWDAKGIVVCANNRLRRRRDSRCRRHGHEFIYTYFYWFARRRLIWRTRRWLGSSCCAGKLAQAECTSSYEAGFLDRHDGRHTYAVGH